MPTSGVLQSSGLVQAPRYSSLSLDLTTMFLAFAAGTSTVTGAWFAVSVWVLLKPPSAVIVNVSLKVLRLISVSVTLPSQSGSASTAGSALQVPEPPL